MDGDPLRPKKVLKPGIDYTVNAEPMGTATAPPEPAAPQKPRLKPGKDFEITPAGREVLRQQTGITLTDAENRAKQTAMARPAARAAAAGEPLGPGEGNMGKEFRAQMGATFPTMERMREALFDPTTAGAIESGEYGERLVAREDELARRANEAAASGNENEYAKWASAEQHEKTVNTGSRAAVGAGAFGEMFRVGQMATPAGAIVGAGFEGANYVPGAHYVMGLPGNVVASGVKALGGGEEAQEAGRVAGSTAAIIAGMALGKRFGRLPVTTGALPRMAGVNPLRVPAALAAELRGGAPLLGTAGQRAAAEFATSLQAMPLAEGAAKLAEPAVGPGGAALINVAGNTVPPMFASMGENAAYEGARRAGYLSELKARRLARQKPSTGVPLPEGEGRTAPPGEPAATGTAPAPRAEVAPKAVPEEQTEKPDWMLPRGQHTRNKMDLSTMDEAAREELLKYRDIVAAAREKDVTSTFLLKKAHDAAKNKKGVPGFEEALTPEEKNLLDQTGVSPQTFFLQTARDFGLDAQFSPDIQQDPHFRAVFDAIAQGHEIPANILSKHDAAYGEHLTPAWVERAKPVDPLHIQQTLDSLNAQAPDANGHRMLTLPPEQATPKMQKALKQAVAALGGEGTAEMTKAGFVVRHRPAGVQDASVLPQAPAQGVARPAIEAKPGRETEIHVAGAKAPIKARYAVVRLRDLKPSHNMRAGKPDANPDYPQGLQPRDYSDPAEMEKVLRYAQEKKADLYLTDTPIATDGPPTITPDGTVINGNGRVMSLQDAFERGDYDWYRTPLTERAAQFGADPAGVAGQPDSVLVRVVGMDPASPEAARFAGVGNVNLTHGQRPIRRAASLNRLVPPEVIRKIGGSNSDTLSNVIGDTPAGKEFREALMKAIPKEEHGDFFNEDGTLHDGGKALVRDMLLTKVLPVEVVEKMQPWLKQAVESALPQMVKVYDRIPEGNIVPQLMEAVHFMEGPLKESGLSPEQYLDQMELGATANKKSISPGGRMLLDFLMQNKGKKNFIKDRLVELLNLKEVEQGFFATGKDFTGLLADALKVQERKGAKFGGEIEGFGKPGSEAEKPVPKPTIEPEDPRAAALRTASKNLTVEELEAALKAAKEAGYEDTDPAVVIVREELASRRSGSSEAPQGQPEEGGATPPPPAPPVEQGGPANGGDEGPASFPGTQPERPSPRPLAPKPEAPTPGKKSTVKGTAEVERAVDVLDDQIESMRGVAAHNMDLDSIQFLEDAKADLYSQFPERLADPGELVDTLKGMAEQARGMGHDYAAEALEFAAEHYVVKEARHANAPPRDVEGKDIAAALARLADKGEAELRVEKWKGDYKIGIGKHEGMSPEEMRAALKSDDPAIYAVKVVSDGTDMPIESPPMTEKQALDLAKTLFENESKRLNSSSSLFGGEAPVEEKKGRQLPKVNLPPELAGAKPRYGYRDRSFDLVFESDLDRAAYVLAQGKKSKQDAAYLKFVMEATGYSEEGAREYGKAVKERIKALAKQTYTSHDPVDADKTSLTVLFEPEGPRYLGMGIDVRAIMADFDKYTVRQKAVIGAVLGGVAGYSTVDEDDGLGEALFKIATGTGLGIGFAGSLGKGGRAAWKEAFERRLGKTAEWMDSIPEKKITVMRGKDGKPVTITTPSGRAVREFMLDKVMWHPRLISEEFASLNRVLRGNKEWGNYIAEKLATELGAMEPEHSISVYRFIGGEHGSKEHFDATVEWVRQHEGKVAAERLKNAVGAIKDEILYQSKRGAELGWLSESAEAEFQEGFLKRVYLNSLYERILKRWKASKGNLPALVENKIREDGYLLVLRLSEGEVKSIVAKAGLPAAWAEGAADGPIIVQGVGKSTLIKWKPTAEGKQARDTFMSTLRDEALKGLGTQGIEEWAARALQNPAALEALAKTQAAAEGKQFHNLTKRSAFRGDLARFIEMKADPLTMDQRKLLQEVMDPQATSAYTISHIHRANAHAQFLIDVAAGGDHKGNWAFDATKKDGSLYAKAGTPFEMPGSDRRYVKAPNTWDWGALKGKLVREDVYRHLNEYFETREPVTHFLDGFLSKWRKAKIVNPVGSVRNLLGNAVSYSYAMDNWFFDPRNWKYYAIAAKKIKNKQVGEYIRKGQIDLAGLTKDEMGALGTEYMSTVEEMMAAGKDKKNLAFRRVGERVGDWLTGGLGLRDMGPLKGWQIRGLYGSVLGYLTADEGEKAKGAAMGAGALIGGGYAYRKMFNLYAAMDPWFKAAAYEKYRARGMNPETAAEEIRKFSQVFGEQGRAVRWSRGELPGVVGASGKAFGATFSSFQAENLRIMGNLMKEKPFKFAVLMSTKAALQSLIWGYLATTGKPPTSDEKRSFSKAFPGDIVLPMRTEDGSLQSIDLTAVLPGADNARDLQTVLFEKGPNLTGSGDRKQATLRLIQNLALSNPFFGGFQTSYELGFHPDEATDIRTGYPLRRKGESQGRAWMNRMGELLMSPMTPGVGLHYKRARDVGFMNPLDPGLRLKPGLSGEPQEPGRAAAALLGFQTKSADWGKVNDNITMRMTMEMKKRTERYRHDLMDLNLGDDPAELQRRQRVYEEDMQEIESRYENQRKSRVPGTQSK